MLTQTRYAKILNILATQNFVEATALASTFNVSGETIRRDLEKLENRGLLTRVHGGAVRQVINPTQTSVNTRATKFWEQKLEIGRIVANYISENEAIAMDASTTNHAIAHILKKKFNSLTIITNYFPIVYELADTDFKVIFLGGSVLSKDLAVVGEMTEQNATQFHCNKALISTSGISLSEGLTDFGLEQVAVKKKLMSIAAKVFVVADSSKFNVVSLYRVCPLDNINKIFTDSLFDKKDIEPYTLSGIEIING